MYAVADLTLWSSTSRDALGRHHRSVHGAQPEENSAGGTHPRKRIQSACQSCRRQKQRCDGLIPCGRCRYRNSVCTYSKDDFSSASNQLHSVPAVSGYLSTNDESCLVSMQGDCNAGPLESPPALDMELTTFGTSKSSLLQSQWIFPTEGTASETPLPSTGACCFTLSDRRLMTC